MDHRGPLTENYANRKGGNDYDPSEQNRRNGLTNMNGTTSSFSTKKSSEDYPHTRAIRTQDAKYRFVPVNENQDRRDTRNQNNRNDQHKIGTEQPRQEQTSNNDKTQQPRQETTNQINSHKLLTQHLQQQQATGNISEYARQVVDLTNEQRRKNGLAALQIDTQLSQCSPNEITRYAKKWLFFTYKSHLWLSI